PRPAGAAGGATQRHGRRQRDDRVVLHGDQPHDPRRRRNVGDRDHEGELRPDLRRVHRTRQDAYPAQPLAGPTHRPPWAPASTPHALWMVQHATAGGWSALHTLPANAAAVPGSPVTFATLITLHNAIVMQQTLASPTNVRLFDLVLSPGSSAAIAQANLAQLG